MRRNLALGALALALLLGGCGGSAKPTGSPAGGPGFGAEMRLDDLQHPGRSVNLFSLFNHDRGAPRLVLLVSPT